MKKATEKHLNLITNLIGITIKKILQKHLKNKYGFSYLNFRCLFIDITYIADRHFSSKNGIVCV